MTSAAKVRFRAGVVTAALSVAGLSAASLPEGSIIELRLLSAVGSHHSKAGDPVSAVVIAPVVLDGRVAVPIGATLDGHVAGVRSVGLGFRRETAQLAVMFDTLRLTPAAEPITIATRLIGIDNARERVDAGGVIHGIRSAGTLGNKLAGISTIAAIEPTLFLYTFSAMSAILRVAEPEVFYPKGTELFVRVQSPVDLPTGRPPSIPPVAASAADERELGRLARALPFRTATPAGTSSDLTNLVLIGSADELTQAFRAGGWVSADDVTFQTGFETFRVMLVKTGYSQAPMSELRLDGAPASAMWQKGLNTFDKRHHLRVFPTAELWKGRPVWVASSTQDIGIAFSKKTRTLIHVIDENIDNERDKVMNDLIAAGCTSAASFVARSWVPTDAQNATGDRLETNGDAGVIVLAPCREAPSIGATPETAAERLRPVPGRPARAVRQIMLTLKDDAVRNNPVYLAYRGLKWLVRRPGRPEGPPRRAVEVDGVTFEVDERDEATSQARPAKQEDAP